MDIPDVIRRAMEAQARTGAIDVEAVEAALAEGEPIPPDEVAVAEQLGDWRSLVAEDPDLSEAERAMIQPSLLENLPVEPYPDGHVGPNPEATIREAFLRFHAENPHVYDELVRLARQAHDRGARKIGIGMLFEVLRWGHLLRTSGDDFKLNNNYRSYYARLILHRHPELDGIFELRRLHGRDLGESDV